MIEKTAIVSPKAKIGQNVSIGHFAIIEDDVEIGDNTAIFPHAIIANGSRIGQHCKIYPNAVISSEPQDLKFGGEKTLTIIGDRTVVRECATINRATKATGKTVVGQDCLIMAYCHIAHDCRLGDNVIMSNVSQLAGHVELEDWVILGGIVKIVQFCRVGKHSMIGADVKVTKDVAPFTLLGRDPAKFEGINKVGLKRRGFDDKTIYEISKFYSFLSNSGLNVTDAIMKYGENESVTSEVQTIIDFINSSKKGIYR